MLLRSDFIFSGTPSRLMKLSRNLMTSLTSAHFHIRKTWHFLYRSIPIKKHGSPVTCLLRKLPEKRTSFSYPGWVVTGSLIFSPTVFDFIYSYRNSCTLLLFSLSFLIPDRQKRLPFATIFVEPGCRKCSASTACLFGSSGIGILSPAISEQNLSVILLKTGANCSGGFFLPVSQTCFQLQQFRINRYFMVSDFQVNHNVELDLLQVFCSASGFFIFGFSNTWFT